MILIQKIFNSIPKNLQSVIQKKENSKTPHKSKITQESTQQMNSNPSQLII